jgi:hypothetical protein
VLLKQLQLPGATPLLLARRLSTAITELLAEHDHLEHCSTADS